MNPNSNDQNVNRTIWNAAIVLACIAIVILCATVILLASSLQGPASADLHVVAGFIF